MKRSALSVVLFVVLCCTASGPAAAQDLIKTYMMRVPFPGTVTIMADVIKDREIDRKNGIDLQPKTFSTVAAAYAAMVKGEVDVNVAGPHVLQKVRNQGAPIKAVFTFVRISSMAVITADPSIKGLKDLKGKTIAADMGSAEYQILAIYGRSQGVVFGQDVTVVQAGPPLARTQLAAKQVDAAMSWETG